MELTREADGSIAIGEIQTVEVLEDGGAPIGALAGRLTLSGRDAAGVDVDGQWVVFPDVIEFERQEALAPRVEFPLTGAVTTVGFVRVSPDVVTLAVVDQMAGVVVTEVPVPSEPAEDLAVAGAQSALIRATSAPSCGHIVVLEGGSLAGVPLDPADPLTLTIEAPGPTQLAVVDAALSSMPKMLCHGIARIAFVEVPSMVELGGFVTHEGGHAVDNLLGSAAMGPTGGGGSWLRSSRGLARQTVDHVRIRGGMRAEWVRMHESFVSQGWAEAYYPSNMAAAEAGVADYSAEATANAGAMSRYGATKPSDDIAEFVSWALLGPAYGAAGYPDARRQKEDFACQALGTYDEGGGIPSRYSAVFAKLMFLRDLGVVWPEDVDRCLGRVGYADVPEGFQFTVDGEVRQLYATGLAGALGVVEATGRRARRIGSPCACRTRPPATSTSPTAGS